MKIYYYYGYRIEGQKGEWNTYISKEELINTTQTLKEAKAYIRKIEQIEK